MKKTIAILLSVCVFVLASAFMWGCSPNIVPQQQHTSPENEPAPFDFTGMWEYFCDDCERVMRRYDFHADGTLYVTQYTFRRADDAIWWDLSCTDCYKWGNNEYDQFTSELYWRFRSGNFYMYERSRAAFALTNRGRTLDIHENPHYITRVSGDRDSLVGTWYFNETETHMVFHADGTYTTYFLCVETAAAFADRDDLVFIRWYIEEGYLIWDMSVQFNIAMDGEELIIERDTEENFVLMAGGIPADRFVSLRRATS